MTNVELLKVFHDVLLQAAKGIEAVLDDCDQNEPDEARPAIPSLRHLYENRELSVRSFNCMARDGVYTLVEAVERYETPKDLTRIRNLGQRSCEEIIELAHKYGLKWRWEK